MDLKIWLIGDRWVDVVADSPPGSTWSITAVDLGQRRAGTPPCRGVLRRPSHSLRRPVLGKAADDLDSLYTRALREGQGRRSRTSLKGLNAPSGWRSRTVSRLPHRLHPLETSWVVDAGIGVIGHRLVSGVSPHPELGWRDGGRGPVDVDHVRQPPPRPLREHRAAPQSRSMSPTTC